MRNLRDVGSQGELIALEWLKNKGYKIVFKNYRKRSFEIDIIAICNNGVLRFVEVKNVVISSVEDACYSIRTRNIVQYTKGIQVFLQQFPEYSELEISMDAIVVNKNNIMYYQNITSDCLLT